MGGLFHKLRHPRRCYVVCTIPRSGSNLLTEGRYGAELGVDPNTDYPGYVRGIVNTKTTRNEVFGFKLMSWYLDDFLARLRDTSAFGGAEMNDLAMLRNAFPRLRFVHIVRRHKLRQALSTARALQTGLWKVQEGKTALREPQFDAELIEQSLREAERQEKIWYTFFQRISIDPFQVEYEELCRNYEATIRSTLDFLKISLPRGARIGSPVTVRQADEISRVWEERFLSERPSAYLPAHG
jgi:trehalose 2-sulfotransferase